jgi:hypothetical protein
MESTPKVMIKMKGEKEYFKKALRNLRVARRYLEKASKEKNKKNLMNLISQFSKRISMSCDYLALIEEDYRKRDKLFKLASEFEKFSKVFKTFAIKKD